jgi:hypothetical protein
MKNNIDLSNLNDYILEIGNKLNNIYSLKNSQNNIEDYRIQSSYLVERLYTLLNHVEDGLELNTIRSLKYSYAISVKGAYDDIFLPVGNASSILTSLQKGLRIFDKNIKLNLVNVLRGSTILCFDYSAEVLNNKKFDYLGVSEKFKDTLNILTNDNQQIEKDLISLYKDKKKMVLAINAFKGLTPTPGSETSVHINTEISPLETIEINTEVRSVINQISPPSPKKNSKVDWINKIATGYIREINDVSKSFLVFADERTDDESKSLIKIHFEPNEFENKIVNLFCKKAMIHFEKEKGRNRYYVTNIK